LECEDVEKPNEALPLDDEALQMDDEALQLDDEALQKDDVALQKDDEAWRMDDEALQKAVEWEKVSVRTSDALNVDDATALETGDVYVGGEKV
jgi:hypothetical protein